MRAGPLAVPFKVKSIGPFAYRKLRARTILPQIELSISVGSRAYSQSHQGNFNPRLLLGDHMVFGISDFVNLFYREKGLPFCLAAIPRITIPE